MKKIMTVDGNEACSYTSYMFTELAGIYPITPSSPMAEHIDEWSNNGRKNLFNDQVKVVEMQSEAGAAGLIHGSLQSGLLTTTYTASQGLLLMVPNMYKMAGEMLPCVIHVAARSLSTHALSIMGDHQDIYATRTTGFNMIASSSVEDAAYLSAVAHLSAIKASLPFLHFFDGFRTSHEINKIEVLESNDLVDMIDKEALDKFRKRALNPIIPTIKGTTQGDDVYFQWTESRNIYYDRVPDIVNEYMEKINKKAQKNYHPFNYYGSEDAEKVIVAMGSVCETIKETIDYIKGKVGLIEVHLYRPFSVKYLLNVLPKSVKKIAVLDRTKEPGGREPLYLDVVSALKNTDIEIVGGRYGLSSKNTTPGMILSVFESLDNPKDSFTIGIEDDLTNTSLITKTIKTNDHEELLIYGFGSDGMVSASKSLIKLVGNNTDKRVQGYFEYDSKKSGGVTISHLRFSKDKIRSTYYVENPKTIVVTKDSYFNDFDILGNIQKKGILIINTSKTHDELIESLNDNVLEQIFNKEIAVYTIDAYELANKLGLNNKISMIMEMVIINLSKIIDEELAINKLKNYIKDKFMKKGIEIVEANNKTLELAVKYIKKIDIEYRSLKLVNNEPKTIFEAMNRRLGNSLKTSSFKDCADGTFIPQTSYLEKKNISEIVPSWDIEKCIECNQCSFVCPHAVIRPFLLDLDEYNKAPEYIKNRCKKTRDNYYYTVAVSIENCTGCGLCIKTCPKNALTKSTLIKEKQEKNNLIYNYLNDNISEKKISKNPIYDTQLKKPKFEFCGACAGCGEATYIKILTQLFGEYMIVANATGCSSIFGSSLPSIPYNVPWASSLFEDNAEFGYGILLANKLMKNRIANIMKNSNDKNKELYHKWLDNSDDFEITKEVYYKLDYKEAPKELRELKNYIIKRSIWTIGGDGWAYDIGFSGIDHVLSSNDDVNILVLDSQIYSNTGGQSSKATPKGALASFATSGKRTSKKDLAKIALAYPNVYVAQISLGANMLQTIKAFKEAEQHKGPSIIIAYSPCISHGIKGGMSNSLEMEKLAVFSGYYPIFRYNPNDKMTIDYKNPNFDLYDEFLNKQTRFSMLKYINKNNYEELLKQNKEEAIKRFEYYKHLSE